MRQIQLEKYHRIVVKVGSNVLTTDEGRLNRRRIQDLVDQISQLTDKGLEIILVSSGSVSAGRSLIDLSPTLESVAKRQVLSSIGQVKLMETYRQVFETHKLNCGQVLASKGDFRDRHHYINMRKCLESLLKAGVVPIVNENDTVSVTELMFTDNDELAALIASMLNVDAVLLLTNVDGIYDKNPNDPDAQVIHLIDPEKEDVSNVINPEKSSFGRGGMLTKYRVAVKLSKMGIATHILNGAKKSCLHEFFKVKETQGTSFIPTKKVSSIKKWISHAASEQKGTITINDNAVKALCSNDKARSLLPIGITSFKGEFVKGDILQIQSEKGKVIGFGLAQYSSDNLKKRIGERGQKPLIHYDYLYLE